MNQQFFTIIFDLDGLMADSEPLAKWAWNQTLARYGRELDDQTFRDVQGMRVADSARLFCERFALPISPEEAMAERDDLFLGAVPTRLHACPGLYPLLDELAARNLLLGVATSGHRRYVSLALQTLELDGRFLAVAAGDEVERGKPAPDIYLLAAERLGVSPGSCLALEDAPLGVEAAVAAGMRCVAVPSQWTAALEFPGAYRVFTSLNEVREALNDLLEIAQSVNSAESVNPANPCSTYTAAGGVVARDGRVLVLRRSNPPSVPPNGGEEGGEVRLPKGHVDPGETAQEAALREVREESGYAGLTIEADLGVQVVEFDHEGRHVVRTEHYFLMMLVGQAGKPALHGEEQFEPVWLPWDEALAALTFEAEREWVRRARAVGNDQ